MKKTIYDIRITFRECIFNEIGMLEYGRKNKMKILSIIEINIRTE